MLIALFDFFCISDCKIIIDHFFIRIGVGFVVSGIFISYIPDDSMFNTLVSLT